MENKIDLINIINEISYREKFLTRLLEKDYEITRIIQNISKFKIDNLIFKGGTCLNKCYLGFYRLSEDIDFVYNKDVNKLSNRQLKIEVNKIKRKLFEILKKLDFKIDERLGKGWKKITKNNRIVNLEINIKYKSRITNNFENIKIDISFRNKLYKKVNTKKINHLFYDSFKKPLLNENIQINCIDLKENIIEKYRALVTRKNIAIRDLYDIYFVFKFKKIKFNKKDKNLIIIKIQETIPNYNMKKFNNFLNNLNKKNIDLQPIKIVLKDNQKIDIRKIITIVETSL